MNDIQIFQNPEFGEIRTIEQDGEPWFVGKDVARALGYGDGKSLANAVADHVAAEDKGVTEMVTPGGRQKMTIINESGLYSLIFGSKLESAMRFKRWVTSEVLPSIRKTGSYTLIMRSDKPEAKRFQRWVTGEVLPSIRKTGGYIAGQESMSDSELMAKALLVAKRQIDAKTAQIEEMTPKAVFADAVAASKTSILIGELAKILRQNGVEDMGQQRLFEWMRNNGFLIRRKATDRNMPTQRAIEQGLMEVKETTICHSDGHTSISKTPKVTGKGQVYFVNRLAGKQIGEAKE